MIGEKTSCPQRQCPTFTKFHSFNEATTAPYVRHLMINQTQFLSLSEDMSLLCQLFFSVTFDN